MPLNKPSSISISFDCHIDHQLNCICSYVRVCAVCTVEMSCMTNVFKIESTVLKWFFQTIWLSSMFHFSLSFNLRQKMKESFVMGMFVPLCSAQCQLADFIKIRYFSINWIYTWINVLFVFNWLKQRVTSRFVWHNLVKEITNCVYLFSMLHLLWQNVKNTKPL